MKTQTQPTDPSKFKFHELCSLFPPMGDEAYKVLVEDIKQNGFDPKNPITTYQGTILDGAHRQTACKKLKITPTYVEYKGDDPISFVIRKNLARRHLTPSQAAALGAELVERIKELEQEAKNAEKEAAKLQAAKAKKGEKVEKVAKVKTTGTKAGKAAAVLNVSERSVAEATKLKKEDPSEFEAVKSGKKTLNAASKASEDKKSAKDKEGDAYAKALDIIERVCGPIKAGSSLKAKDVIKLSGLDKEEIKRIKPFIESGWTLSAALGYKSATLSLAHTIRAGVDRAISQGGKHTMDATAYGKEFIIEFTEKN